MALTLPDREPLGNFPTALVEHPSLGSAVGVERLWVKRDDLSGFSWGGNKVRTAEFLIGAAISMQITDVIIAGGPTSNFALIMAAACRCAGIEAHQVAYGDEPASPPITLAAARASGATVRFTGSLDRSVMERAAADLAQTLENEGRRPMAIPRGGATPLGGVGFFVAAQELHTQLIDAGLANVTIVIPVGSTGSIAGLLAGQAHLGADWRVVGASVSRPVDEVRAGLATKVPEIAHLVGLAPEGCLDTLVEHVEIVDCRGDAFGKETSAERTFREALSAATGLLIDPTYNNKALRWLASSTLGASGGPIVYWLTGGSLNALPQIPLPRTNQ